MKFDIVKAINDWLEERRFTVKCDNCGVKFHTKKRAGICPHIDIKSFIYDANGELARLIEGFKKDILDPWGVETSQLITAINDARVRKLKIENLPVFPGEKLV